MHSQARAHIKKHRHNASDSNELKKDRKREKKTERKKKNGEMTKIACARETNRRERSTNQLLFEYTTAESSNTYVQSNTEVCVYI